MSDEVDFTSPSSRLGERQVAAIARPEHAHVAASLSHQLRIDQLGHTGAGIVG
jgi:hypothetical protein